ncbi:MAG: 2TM domain-containing protein [Caulobacteraceae bacterium]
MAPGNGDANQEAELRRLAERRADAKLGFRSHALVFVLVNAGLATLNFVTSPGYLWFYWPLFGWGLGLAAHAFSVYGASPTLREDAIASEMERLKRRP